MWRTRPASCYARAAQHPSGALYAADNPNATHAKRHGRALHSCGLACCPPAVPRGRGGPGCCPGRLRNIDPGTGERRGGTRPLLGLEGGWLAPPPPTHTHTHTPPSRPWSRRRRTSSTRSARSSLKCKGGALLAPAQPMARPAPAALVASEAQATSAAPCRSGDTAHCTDTFIMLRVPAGVLATPSLRPTPHGLPRTSTPQREISTCVACDATANAQLSRLGVDCRPWRGTRTLADGVAGGGPRQEPGRHTITTPPNTHRGPGMQRLRRPAQSLPPGAARCKLSPS